MNRDNIIRIVIEAVTRGLDRGMRGAIRMVRDFGGSLRAVGNTATAVWNGITQGIFFTREALQTLITVAQSLFDVLLRGSIDARRMEVTFTNITGSADTARQMMEELEQTSESLGISFEEAAQTGQQLAVASRNADGSFDINKWRELQEITRDFSALRPDVPLQLMARGVTAAASGDMSTLTRLLDVNVNQLLGLRDAADEVVDRGGQLQGVAEVRAAEVEATARGGIDALNQLRDAVGATGLAETLAGEFDGVSGQIREEFKDIAREFGDEILPVLTDVLRELLELFREHEGDIESFASNMGKLVADVIAGIDWDEVATDAERFANAIQRVFEAARSEVQQGGVGNVTIPGTEKLGFLNTAAGWLGTPGNPLPNTFGGAGLTGGNPNNAPSLLEAIRQGNPGSAFIPIRIEGDAANRTIGEIAADAIEQAFSQVFGKETETSQPVPHANLWRDSP